MKVVAPGSLKVKIKGFQGTSLLDYPGKISAIIFTGGCNFRCPFCHNPELVIGVENIPDIPLEEIFKKLEQRRGFIDAVAITGGEPLLYPDIVGLIAVFKQMGFLVKVDTNGSFPANLERLINSGNADFIAMDVKTSIENYSKGAGVEVDTGKILRSIKLIKNWEGESEFRITVVPGIVTTDDLRSLIPILSGSRKVVLQQFRNRITLDPEFQNLYPYPREELIEMGEFLKGAGINVEIRGI